MGVVLSLGPKRQPEFQELHDEDKEKDAAPTASMFLYFWDVEEEGGEEEDGGWVGSAFF